MNQSTLAPRRLGRRLPGWMLLAMALVAGLALWWLVSTSRAATETPEYKVIRGDGEIEVRDYPALTIATTQMDSDEMNGSFGQLFGFITGRNEASEKIEMTTPVLIDTKAEQKTMSFIMPRAAVEKGVPKPAGGKVSLRTVEAARYTVLRFPGSRTPENEKAAISRLKGWLEKQKIAAEGEPMFAYYDPPWTPVPLRRNEVMIQIGKGQE